LKLAIGQCMDGATAFIRANLPHHGQGYDIGGLLSSHFDKKLVPAFDDIHQPVNVQAFPHVLFFRARWAAV
jgi:hypothetical protein